MSAPAGKRGRTAVSLFRSVVLLFSTVVLVAACGLKGPPVPLRQTAPAAITDLRLERDGNQVTLLWSYPRATLSGEPLERIERFEILRVEVAEADYCAGCPLRFAKLPAVAGGPVGEESRGRYEFLDLRPGYRYFFKIRAVAGWQRVGPDSNIVFLAW